jgi:Asp-tRNA(Asn)/Glu-tRNA(Gln) amidotransferase B subunit
VTSDAVNAAIAKAIATSPEIVEKIHSSGIDRPVMPLVVKVLKEVDRKGDPVVIKKLLLEQIAQLKTGKKDDKK